MRPKTHTTTGLGDLFRARLEQIINMKHELVQLGDKIDWDWIDNEIAPLFSDRGRPAIETRFVIGILLLKHIYGLSDECVSIASMISARRGATICSVIKKSARRLLRSAFLTGDANCCAS